MYLILLRTHLSLAILSGSVFLVRGLFVLCGHGARANSAAVRHASYGIDSLLLAAAVALLAWLHWAPLQAPWLQLKLGLLVIYIVLGALALRYARRHWLRLGCFIGALCALGAIFQLALSH